MLTSYAPVAGALAKITSTELVFFSTWANTSSPVETSVIDTKHLAVPKLWVAVKVVEEPSPIATFTLSADICWSTNCFAPAGVTALPVSVPALASVLVAISIIPLTVVEALFTVGILGLLVKSL